MDKKYKTMLIVSVLIILLLVLIISLTSIDPKRYDVEAIQEQSLRYYEESEIRIMDFMDMTSLFGIDLTDSIDSVFLGNVSAQDEITTDTIMIAVVNTDTPEYYYDIFRSYLDSNIMNIEDNEILELYNKAILKQSDGYVYFILSNEAEVIEKDINALYK